MKFIEINPGCTIKSSLRWHQVRAKRHFAKATLTVDSYPTVTARSRGAHSRLNAGDALYLGEHFQQLSPPSLSGRIPGVLPPSSDNSHLSNSCLTLAFLLLVCGAVGGRRQILLQPFLQSVFLLLLSLSLQGCCCNNQLGRQL